MVTQAAAEAIGVWFVIWTRVMHVKQHANGSRRRETGHDQTIQQPHTYTIYKMFMMPPTFAGKHRTMKVHFSPHSQQANDGGSVHVPHDELDGCASLPPLPSICMNPACLTSLLNSLSSREKTRTHRANSVQSSHTLV